MLQKDKICSDTNKKRRQYNSCTYLHILHVIRIVWESHVHERIVWLCGCALWDILSSCATLPSKHSNRGILQPWDIGSFFSLRGVDRGTAPQIKAPDPKHNMFLYPSKRTDYLKSSIIAFKTTSNSIRWFTPFPVRQQSTHREETVMDNIFKKIFFLLSNHVSLWLQSHGFCNFQLKKKGTIRKISVRREIFDHLMKRA